VWGMCNARDPSSPIRCVGQGVGSELRRVGFCGEADGGASGWRLPQDGEAVMTKKVLHLLLRNALMPTQRTKHRREHDVSHPGDLRVRPTGWGQNGWDRRFPADL